MDRIPPLREFLCSDSETRDLLRVSRDLALVGNAADVQRVARQMRRFGYRIRCVTRDAKEVAGRPTFDSLHDLVGPLDSIVVLTPAVDLDDVVKAALALGVVSLWLGRGVGDPAAAWRAHGVGMRVIFHRDPVDEYAMHFDDLELGYPVRRDG